MQVAGLQVQDPVTRNPAILVTAKDCTQLPALKSQLKDVTEQQRR